MSEETLTSSSEQAAGLVPLEWLENQICELAGHLTATTAQFLTLLGDFDARSGWAEWDLPSCAAWLSWKCQLTSGTAREHVRVARALRTLPVISAEFAAGRMSFAKVRALTRIATPVTEAGLAELAGPMTASQLERFVRAHRQVSRANAEDAITARRLTWREEDDGSLSVSIKLPAADGAVVLQALRAAAGDLEHPHDKEASDEAPPAAAGLADALVEIAGGYLAGKIATADNPDIYQVIVHADATVLAEPPASPEAAGVSAETPDVPAETRRSHIEDGPALSAATVQRLACEATMTWMLHDHDGNLLDVGRRHRRPPPALRRAVRARYGARCQAPGCNSRRTDIHHIVYWSRLGKTALENLYPLCRRHHVLVHEGGYRIVVSPEGLIFLRPDGTVMPASPALPAPVGEIAAQHDADITPTTIIPNWNGDRLNLDLAIWACFGNARLAEERALDPAAGSV
jgi:uncharacterized protein DUF222/HNH endonuclease